jgi:predicted ATPase
MLKISEIEKLWAVLEAEDATARTRFNGRDVFDRINQEIQTFVWVAREHRDKTDYLRTAKRAHEALMRACNCLEQVSDDANHRGTFL